MQWTRGGVARLSRPRASLGVASRSSALASGRRGPPPATPPFPSLIAVTGGARAQVRAGGAEPAVQRVGHHLRVHHARPHTPLKGALGTQACARGRARARPPPPPPRMHSRTRARHETWVMLTCVNARTMVCAISVCMSTQSMDQTHHLLMSGVLEARIKRNSSQTPNPCHSKPPRLCVAARLSGSTSSSTRRSA